MKTKGLSNVIHLISSGSRKVELGKNAELKDEKENFEKSGSEERKSEVRKKEVNF